MNTFKSSQDRLFKAVMYPIIFVGGLFVLPIDTLCWAGRGVKKVLFHRKATP